MNDKAIELANQNYVEKVHSAAKAGDLISTRSTTGLGKMIRYALSRGPDRCIVNHDALIGEFAGTKFVLWHRPPSARIVTLGFYLAHHLAEGWKFQVYRPEFLAQRDFTDSKVIEWRLDISRYLRSLSGQNYKETQLAWILFRNIFLTQWLKWPKIKFQAAQFCTGSCFDTWSKGPTRPDSKWIPRAYKEARLPTPLHTQRAVIHEDLLPVVPGELHDMILLAVE